MREISMTQPATQIPVFSFLPYGVTRSGKTHWAATLPRPLIIADVAESGYKTILNMDREQWFEPDVEPLIIGIDQMSDIANLMAANGRVDQLIACGRIKSIVFDAFTYYCDMFLAFLTRLDTKGDNRKIYGDLGKHLRELRTITGSKGVNVAYCCLEQPPDAEQGTKGLPQIPGNQGGKFAGGVDFLWHAKFRNVIDKGQVVDVVREMRTRPDGPWIAGNRLGQNADMLPDPFVGSYSDLLAVLGYDVEVLRKSLKPIKSIIVPKFVAPAPVAAPATPPVAKPVASPVARPVNNGTRPNVPAPKVTPPQAK
jgi:hypothetical protein